MLPGVLLEFRNIIRIGKKAHVENQVAVGGNSVAITEAGDVDTNFCLVAIAVKFVDNQVPQLVDVQLGSVDSMLRQLPDGSELVALGFDALGHRQSGAQRMRTARFTVTPHQRSVVRLEKE